MMSELMVKDKAQKVICSCECGKEEVNTIGFQGQGDLILISSHTIQDGDIIQTSDMVINQEINNI